VGVSRQIIKANLGCTWALDFGFRFGKRSHYSERKLMKAGFRQSMSWLHTWSGLILVWMMYFIFVTGTVGYFDIELDQYMQPELPTYNDVSLEESVDTAENYLREHAYGAENWSISPVRERNPFLSLSWRWSQEQRENLGKDNGFLSLDVKTGEPLDFSIRDTGGGQLLYKMHYKLHYIDEDTAYIFIGIVTLIMFLGVITGIVIHRKIFIDLFTLRPNKGSRGWLDFHNVFSVTSLPFQLMISYSGLIFMVTTFFPLIAIGGFGFDTQVAREEIPKILGAEKVEPANTAGTLIDVSDLVVTLPHTAEQVRGLSIKFPGDANAEVHVNLNKGVATRSSGEVKFNGITGEQLPTSVLESNAGFYFGSVMLGLHEGLFADIELRWLYFLSGVLGSLMIATGAIYWVRKRKARLKPEQDMPFGLVLVENLNIGTIVGLMNAIAAYIIANRLLPLGIEHRGNYEVNTMFLIWAACLLHPIFRTNKYKAWIEQLLVAGIAYSLIPVVNALTTEFDLLSTIADRNWVFAGVDITAILTALVFFICAWLMYRRQVSVGQIGMREQLGAGS
jgi:uncharacterized iron-regulated membrane protein